MTSRFDAIVVGAGTNGLAAAATFAKRGKRVLVLERVGTIGGLDRLVDVAPGFRSPLGHDAGWVAPSVASDLGLRRVAMTAPSVGLSLVHDDGILTLPTNVAAAQAVIRNLSSQDAARWPLLVDRLHRLAAFLGALYTAPAPDIAATSLSGLASLAGLGRRARALGRDTMVDLLRLLPMPVQDMLEDALQSPLLVAALSAGGVRDLRQGPRSGGTTFVLLHYLIGAPPGSVRARSWPTASPTAFVDALAAQLAKRRVEIRTDTEVARILVVDDAVSGVVLANGEEISAPMVLSTADPRRTLRELADTRWLDPELLRDAGNIKMRGSTAFVHYALDGLPNASPATAEALASIVTLSSSADAIERAYDSVKYDELSERPHVEISVPSLRWPALAPDGKHVLVARVQYVPTALRDSGMVESRVTAMIEAALPGFGDRIVARQVRLPADLATEFAVTDGAITHGELTLDQILFMRPVPGWNHGRAEIAGLLLGGSGSHPGPGVVGGAGWLEARRALP